MKRLMSLAIALLLCVVPLCAMAEAAPLYELADVDWIDGTNLLSMEGRDGYCVAQMDGTPITEEKYGRSFNYEGGLIVASLAVDDGFNTTGALNLEGAEVIPFQYGDIKVLNSDWALALVLAEATADHYDYQSLFSDGYYLIDSVDVYNLGSGACVATLTRAQYSDAEAYGHTINIEDRSTGAVTAYDAEFNVLGSDLGSVYDDDYATWDVSIFRENGRQGLMDAQGNVIMEPSFQYIESFYADQAKVSDGENYGLIDDAGNVLLPAEFERIDRAYYGAEGTSGYENAGYFCVEVDGKLGYAIAGGAITCEPKYSADALDNNGASATYTDMEGKIHILAADGVESVVEGYERVYPADHTGGVFYRVNDADYNYGLIDFHGNVVLPCEFEGVSVSGDGRYVLAKPDYDLCDIYELSYPEAGEPAAASAGAPAEAEEAAEAEEVGEAEEAGEAEETATNSSGASVASLLDSAILLLNQDAGANGAAAVSLLNAAAAQLGADSPAGGLIAGAVTLLNADAAANGSAAVTLLENAKALM